MAYDTRGSFTTRRSRQLTREQQQLANRRLRRLGNKSHPFRWCPEEEVSILVGPDYICPACGTLTSAL